MNHCLAPFCENIKYYNKGKSYGYCKQHIYERAKYNVKSYKELLPLWCFLRCSIHGLLNYDQVYIHNLKHSIKKVKCKKCTKNYINKNYDPKKQKIRNAKSEVQIHFSKIQKKYGIDSNQYYQMLLNQNNSCAICEIHLSDYIKNHKGQKLARKYFDVDHCHRTGAVRGLLCRPCNIGIGFLKSKKYNMEKAASYLSA